MKVFSDAKDLDLFCVQIKICCTFYQNTITDYAKEIKMSIFDSGLPGEPFESWFANVVGPDATVTWDEHVCGEGGEYGLAPSVCATATARTGDCGYIVLSIGTGDFAESVSGKPYVRDIRIAGLGPSVYLKPSDIAELEENMRLARERDELLSSIPINPINKKESIEYAKNIDTSLLDDRLPSKTLEEWFAELAGPDSEVEWKSEAGDGCVRPSLSYKEYIKVNEKDDPCSPKYEGKQSNRGYDCWAYVQAHFENSSESVYLSVRVGTIRKGIFGKPVSERVFIYNKGDGIKKFPIHEFPKVLERIRKGELFYPDK
ncbi:hypothetical protein LCGC14_1134650 [marine sediment metagenome]|uniref:Uncharacterized protein n=1 Tax=marine sediment metagenome TaxID=412755 RepID=A0A0F9M062_9ZZZZ